LSTLILDYAVGGAKLANPDGTLPATVERCTVVPGPGATPLGTFPRALSLVPDGSIRTTLPPAAVRADQLCARIVFSPLAAVASPQTLVACTLVPFSVRIEAGAAAGRFNAIATVENQAAGPDEASTQDRAPLGVDSFHVLDLVYDVDTLAVLVDGQVLAVTAFPEGALAGGTGLELVLGTAADGTGRFQGAIAAFQLHAGIPIDLEAQVDDQRRMPEWHIRRKRNEVRGTVKLGNPVGDIQWDPALQAHVQGFDRGSIQYVPTLGAAFVVAGAIWDMYRDPAIQPGLGHAAGDEVDARAPGCRKMVFARGAIYQTPAGVATVWDRIFHRYEDMGETASALGFPYVATRAVVGGYFQDFQHGVIYYKSGQEYAYPVVGDVAAAYGAQGGPAVLGFPRGGEYAISKDAVALGRALDCDLATLYAAPGLGAFAVLGPIRSEYQSRGGPLSDLGFPTAPERGVPGDPTGRFTTFQGGTIVSFAGAAVTCVPFQIYLGRLETDGSDNVGDDGIGDNDLYFDGRLTRNGTVVFDQRFPPDQPQYPESNSADVQQRLPPVFDPTDPGLAVELSLHVMDSDLTSDDDLGTFRQTLSLANAWGLRDHRDGIENTGRFDRVQSFSWAVQSVASAAAPRDFWGAQNRGTPELTQAQYGAAFRNVDSDPEWYDPSDWINQAYYELVVKGIAAGGNCFGMSLEAAYAWKGQSLFSLPLSRFTSWPAVEHDINIRHAYQAGAESIWWLVGQFVQGHTHDPVTVFNETRDCAARGDRPVLCLAQNADFSGAPHCILPASWDTSKTPWRMQIFDPNFMSTLRDVFVDPVNNRFSYAGASSYAGTASDGGRLYYFPFSVLGERPRTPDFELLMLLMAGIILFVGDSGETVSLTDPGGGDLDGTNPSVEPRDLKTKFFRYRGVSGADPVGVDVFFHRDPGRLVIPPAENRPAPPPSQPAPPPVPLGFVHTLRARKPGPLSYAWKHGLAGFRVTAPLGIGERLVVAADGLGTDTAMIKVTTPSTRRIALELGGRRGAGAGAVRVVIDNLEAPGGAPVQIAERPGRGAIDIVGAMPGKLKVTVEAVAGAKQVVRTFDVPFTGSMRLVPLPQGGYGRLKVGDITTLRGPIQTSSLLTAL
jgi:hypothetical protein